MFVMGLIIGIIIGAVGSIAAAFALVPKIYNTTVDEFTDVLNLTYEAGHDRESIIAMIKDDEIIDEVVLEEQ